MMRHFVSILVLVLANGVIYFFLTGPTLGELERLERHHQELDDVLATEEKNTAKWNRLAELVEAARLVLEPLDSGEGSAQSGLRRVFLDAEKGLQLRRDTLELRPERRPPEGFGGVRVQVVEEGDFVELFKYLNRISQSKMPMALVEMSLAESAKDSASLVLSATFSALWPES